MATKSIKVNGKTINYTIESTVNRVVSFSDGTVVDLIGSISAPVILKAYKAKKASEVPVVVVPEPVTPPVIIIKPSPGEFREITIDEYGKLEYIEKDNFKLKGGIYDGQYWHRELKDVNIDLSAAQFVTKNMPSHELKGVFENVSYYGANFKDTTSSGFSYREENMTGLTVVKDLRIIGSKSENSGGIFSGGGGIKNEGFGLVFQGLVIKDFTFKNSPGVGTIVYCSSLDGFDFGNGVIDNVNGNSDIHNGLFMIAGNGKLHDIRCTNHQGDLMRAVPHQILSTDAILDVYNNIVWNSRKYGAFEVQVYQYVKESSAFKAARSLIRNNTVGKLNTSHSWDAKLVDVYETYAAVDIVNNLGFELYQANQSAITKLANAMSGPSTPISETSNVYTNSAALAVEDTVNFKSLYKGVGAQ